MLPQRPHNVEEGMRQQAEIETGRRSGGWEAPAFRLLDNTAVGTDPPSNISHHRPDVPSHAVDLPPLVSSSRVLSDHLHAPCNNSTAVVWELSLP